MKAGGAPKSTDLALRIVLTGGGSGGHITPILAVATELKRLLPNAQIIYIGQKGDSLADLPARHPAIDAVYSVRAGKFRRYHGEGLRALFDLPTIAQNLRDLLYIAIGLVQSYVLLRRLKPAVVFTRGGYVSVPVAIGGRLTGVPYVTHDSDSTPSLANRLIARWASVHAVALPVDLYPYPAAKTVLVGVPVTMEYQPVSVDSRASYLQDLQLPADSQVVLITGGGNGARRLNEIVLANSKQLLTSHPKLILLHTTGRAQEASVAADYAVLLPTELRPRVVVIGYTTDFHRYSGAADVIIARGGATNLAEFAIQRKACLLVPSPQLIWNVRNSQALADRGAVGLLTEVQAEQEGRLATVVGELLDDDAKRQKLADQLANFARPDATKDLAQLILNQTKHHQGRSV